MSKLNVPVSEAQYDINLLSRLDAKTVPGPRVPGLPKRCRVWTGAKSSNKYGAISIGPRGADKQAQVHRVAYHYYVDRSVPIFPGKQTKIVIDHLCRNTLCIEPAHLESVPQRKNVVRGLVSDLNPNKSSRFVGVSWYKRARKWQAQIRVDGVVYSLGYYGTEEEAAVVYKCAKIRSRLGMKPM